MQRMDFIHMRANKKKTMKNDLEFDVLIIGGSYAGLSAAMTLGRSLRHAMIIDSGKPCNRQTPYSHNMITLDGQTPGEITAKALEQVLAYKTVQLHNGSAVRGTRTATGFEVTTSDGKIFSGRKLLFATGVKDEMPPLPGFAECWGISVLHCPYCHGYEVSGKTLGLMGNGDMGYEFCKLISHWSKDLILFTNGKSTLSEEQESTLRRKNIRINERAIARLAHQQGHLQHVLFQDCSKEEVTAVFARVAFSQHCGLPVQLGCALSAEGYIQVDDFQKTSIAGAYAAGDNTTPFRTVSVAIAAGTKAGAVMNKELIDEDFS